MPEVTLYSIFDSKAESFLQPFFAPTDAVALRWVRAAINDPQHDFHKYSADYTLFRVGSFSTKTGEVKSMALVNLGCLIALGQVPVKEVK